MNLACPTCQARYRIADEKVRGRIVKIRCKKCGAIVVADGSDGPADRAEPAPSTTTPRTGQRHEQSVLFSLSALQRTQIPSAPTAPAAEPSGLIDLRMLSAGRSTSPEPRAASDAIVHLGTGGAFAPIFVGDYDAALQAGRSRSRASVLLPCIAPALVVAFAMARSLGLPAKGAPPASAPTPALVTTIPAVAAQPALASPSASAPPVAATAEPAAPVSARVVVSPPLRPAAGVPAVPVERGRACCPGEDDATCEMRRSIGKACAAPAAPPLLAFDAAAAGRALSAVDLRRCTSTGAADGHARVTFQPNGAVSGVVVDTPELAGTGAERCVSEAYRRVAVAAFIGPALTVGKRFRLGPGT